MNRAGMDSRYPLQQDVVEMQDWFHPSFTTEKPAEREPAGPIAIVQADCAAPVPIKHGYYVAMQMRRSKAP
jgi:hypothetical protein